MIHHVQRKRIHNAAAINKGMKHWSKVLFIWRLHAADVCSSLPPPPLFLSFLTTFSETGHITTARYAVKDVLKSRCCGFTVHNAGLKARFALYVSNRGMWVCLCYWTWPRRCRFRVQRGFFFESQEVSTALPERASTPNPQGLLSQYLRNPWPLAKTGRLPLSVAQTVLQSPVYSLPFGGFQGSSSLSSPARTCWGPSRSRSEAKTQSGSAVFICVCYAIMCDLVESSLELCLFC